MSPARSIDSVAPTVHPVRHWPRHCMDAIAICSAPCARASTSSYQATRRSVRRLPGARRMRMRRLSRDSAAGARASGRLESDAQGARHADALLEVRKEGRRGRGSCEAETARSAKESALNRRSDSNRFAAAPAVLAAACGWAGFLDFGNAEIARSAAIAPMLSSRLRRSSVINAASHPAGASCPRSRRASSAGSPAR